MVDPHTWTCIEQALDLPVDQQGVYLASVLEGSELEAARAILQRNHQASDFFDELAEELESARGEEIRVHEERVAAPEKIEVYRLVERRGSGGMGEVYLAQRDDGQFHQQVAIKLMRRSLGDGVSQSRFRAERQILANFEHPNIARLIGGGVTEGGRPYLVMEWVDGMPIDVWCNQERIDVEGRVRLFLDACSAVEYAHRGLVVHRDLKPTNILVNQEGRVKLLDFGIAKMLREDQLEVESSDSAESSAVDATFNETVGSRDLRRRGPFTPRYAAPEQLENGAITTATDVYGLGAVLYELLTGVAPTPPSSRMEPGSTNQKPVEAAGTDPESVETVAVGAAANRLGRPAAGPARRAGPMPPGALLAHNAEQCETAAKQRSTTPRRLLESLRGDLDAICSKALSLDPADRYSSAAALRADLERTLERRPVEARPANVSYRFARWLDRNRALGVLAAILLLLSTWFTVQLTQQYRATVQERDKAQSVTGLLVDLFRSADPLLPQREAPTAATILERGRVQAEQLDQQPVLQASMLDVLGQVHRNVGQHDEAIGLHTKAVSLHRTGPAANRQGLAESLRLLAEALRLNGEFDEAESNASEALDIARAFYGPGDVETARIEGLLGRIHFGKRQLDRARQFMELSLDTRRAQPEEAGLEVAETLNDLAAVELLSGNLETAERLFREALALRKRELDVDHPSIAALENNLAAVLSGQARFAEAEELYRSLAPRLEAHVGKEHLHTINARRNLGLVLLQQGREAEGLVQLQDAARRASAALPAEHPLNVVLKNYVGFAQLELDQLDEARATLESALDLGERAFSQDDPRLASALNNIGLLEERVGNLEAAEQHLRRARELVDGKLPDEHPQTLTLNSNFARLAYLQGRIDEAADLFEVTIAKQRYVLPAGHPDLAYSLDGFGRVAASRGNVAAARQLFTEALELRRAVFPAGHRRIAEIEERLAVLSRSPGEGSPGGEESA